jgi:lysyl-tRNA synthetase class 2
MNPENPESAEGAAPDPSSRTEENEVVALRRERLERLQREGRDPYAHVRFDRTHLSAEIHEKFEDLEGQKVRVAGRVRSRRGQGKIGFA